MKAQAKLHHAIAERNKVKFGEKDREMLNEIEKICSVHVRQQLQELWRNDCKKQEEKSQNLWEVKRSWFEKFQSSGENVSNKPSSGTRKAQKCETTVVKQTAKQQPPKKKQSILQ